MRKKIAQFCNVAPDAVIESRDAHSIYDVPVKMHEEHLDEIVMRKLDMGCRSADGHSSPYPVPHGYLHGRRPRPE